MGELWSKKEGSSAPVYVPSPRPPTPPKELEDKPWREEGLVYSEAKPEQLQSRHQGHDITSIIQISDILLPFPDFKVVFMKYYDLHVVAQAKREALWPTVKGLTTKHAYERELRAQMESKFAANKKVKRANILLLGPIKAGKSSYLNSVAGICKDRIAKVVRSGEADNSLTTKYGKFAPKTGIMKNFRLLDCMGLEAGEGFNVDEVCYLVRGNVPKDYQFNPRSPITEDDPSYIKNPKEKDKVHCVVVVIDAESLYGELPDIIKQRIRDLKIRLDKFDIQQVVVLTKIDKLCRKVNEDIANVYRSVKVHKMVKIAAELFRLPENQIFPLKNYFEETTMNFKLNIPILLALRMMITMASDYIEYRDDEDDDDDED